MTKIHTYVESLLFLSSVYIFAFATTAICNSTNSNSSTRTSGSFYRAQDYALVTAEDAMMKMRKTLRYSVRYKSRSVVECLTRCDSTIGDDFKKIKKALMIGSMCYCGVSRKGKNTISRELRDGDIDDDGNIKRIVFYKGQDRKINKVIEFIYSVSRTK